MQMKCIYGQKNSGTDDDLDKVEDVLRREWPQECAGARPNKGFSWPNTSTLGF